jgi:DNA-binding SARP family transcriptional activator
VLEHLETEILTRTRLLEETGGQDTPPPLVLITTAHSDPRRLQAVADLGIGLNVSVVVLGPWPAGITCQITADGQISSVLGNHAPDWIAALAGLRIFTAGTDDTRQLLALLSQRPTSSGPEPSSEVTGQPPTHPTPNCHTTLAPPRIPAAPPPEAPARQESRDPRPASPPGDAIHRDPVPSDIEARLTPPAPRTPTPGTTGSAPRQHQARPVHVTVIGRLQVRYRPSAGEAVDLTIALAPRQRDIVVYLALHPDGVRRETLTAALWPDAPRDRPYNSLHTTLSQMRRAVRKATDNTVDSLTVNKGGYYALHPDVVDVDLWQMYDALHARRHAPSEQELAAALHQIVRLYRGELAEAVAGEWIDAPREALRRDVLDALAELTRIVREGNPERALELLEQARHLDPHSEAIYRDILRTQARLGYQDAIPRTLALLRTALAEVDARPTADTLALAASMQRTGTAARAQAPSTGSGRSSSGAALSARDPDRSGQNGT